MNKFVSRFFKKSQTAKLVVFLLLIQALVIPQTSLALGNDADNSQVISVSIPATEATWSSGKVMNISWQAGSALTNSLRYIQGVSVTTGGTFNIEYELKSLGSSGTYAWTIPSWLPAGKYKIRVGTQPIGFGPYRDSSEFNLVTAVVPPTPVSSVTVNMAKPITAWQIGQVVPISWTATGNAVNSLRYIKAVNVASGGAFSIENEAKTLGSSGTYNWTIPSNFPIGQYKIRVGVQPDGYGIYGDSYEMTITAKPDVLPTVSGNSVNSSYLFALNNQDDKEGKVNNDIYASFNRVIAGNRNGQGVEKVVINLKKNGVNVEQCTLNLLKNTNTCSGSKSASIVNQNSNQQAVVKINLDKQYYDSASFEIQYSSLYKPSGWTVDIGDSLSNDGWGGDNGDSTNDAEVNVVNGDILVYGNDNAPVAKRLLYEVDKVVLAGNVLVINVSNNHFDWKSSGAVTVIEDRVGEEKTEIKNEKKQDDNYNQDDNKNESVKDSNDDVTIMPITVAPTVTPTTKTQLDDDKLVVKLQRQITNLEQKIIDLEKSLVSKIDDKLTDKLKGRILLQVEDKGQAWYVDPASKNKLYLKDGQAAYDIMRALGLGIKTADLEKIPVGIQTANAELLDTDGDGLPDDLEKALGTDVSKVDTDGDGFNDMAEISSNNNPDGSGKLVNDQKLVNRMKGKILLQVEDRGQAWYINPTDGKRYFLGDGDTAYEVMRKLSLGINNDQLRKIQVGEFEERAQ